MYQFIDQQEEKDSGADQDVEMSNEEGSEYDQMPQIVTLSQDIMSSMKCLQNFFHVIVEGGASQDKEILKGAKASLINKCIEGNDAQISNILKVLTENGQYLPSDVS